VRRIVGRASAHHPAFLIEEPGIPSHGPAICVCRSALLLAIFLVGCSKESSGQRQPVFSQEELCEPYRHIILKKSLTIDALPKIQRFQSDRGPLLGGVEVLSQGQSIAASLGQSKDGRETWFNMVTFDEYKLNVIRKYFFVVDEDAAHFPAPFRRGLRFDCEMVLDQEILDESYPSENARRIAILRRVLENLRNDMEALPTDANSPNQDNKMLSVCGMLLNQTLEMILVKLDASPVLAMKLSEPPGVDFDHINFGEGKVLMVVQDDMVGVRLRFGAFAVAEDNVSIVNQKSQIIN
jgi:hypothetical protein